RAVDRWRRQRSAGMASRDEPLAELGSIFAGLAECSRPNAESKLRQSERERAGNGAPTHQSDPLRLDLRSVRRSGKTRNERQQQFLAQRIVADSVVETDRIGDERPGERDRQVARTAVRHADAAVGIAGGDDGRLDETGPAVRAGELVASPQQLPVQQAIEIVHVSLAVCVPMRRRRCNAAIAAAIRLASMKLQQGADRGLRAASHYDCVTWTKCNRRRRSDERKRISLTLNPPQLIRGVNISPRSAAPRPGTA